MKKSLFSLLLIVIIVVSLVLVTTVHFGEAQSSGTNVSGVITSDTTWTQANSPYTFTGPIAINAGVTLTIQPGVIVNIGTNYLQVNGTLDSRGQSNNPIVINGNSNVHSGYPGYVNTGSSGYQILFTSRSSRWNELTGTGSIIQNANLNYIPVEIDGASPKIDNNIITFNQSQNSYEEAIIVSGGSPIISSNTITMNCSGRVTNGITVKAIPIERQTSPTISNNTMSGINTLGYGVYSIGNATIIDNSIYGWEMGISSANDFFYQTNNTIIRNVICSNNGTWSFGIFLDSNDVSIVENNTINSNPYGIGTVSSKPLILYNNIYGNQYNLYVLGSADINASYNWWGTNNIQAINQTIYDFKNDFNYGNTSFIPFLTAPNTQAPTFVNSTVGAGGSISPSGIVSLNYGGGKTFTITANTGFHIADVLVNGTSVGAMSSYPIQNVNGATTIFAVFTSDSSPTPTASASPTPTNSPASTPTSPPATSTATPTNSPSVSPAQTPLAPEFPSMVVLTLLIVGITPAIVLIMRKRRKT